jgi:hypothetical protein
VHANIIEKCKILFFPASCTHICFINDYRYKFFIQIFYLDDSGVNIVIEGKDGNMLSNAANFRISKKKRHFNYRKNSIQDAVQSVWKALIMAMVRMERV